MPECSVHSPLRPAMFLRTVRIFTWSICLYSIMDRERVHVFYSMFISVLLRVPSILDAWWEAASSWHCQIIAEWRRLVGMQGPL